MLKIFMLLLSGINVAACVSQGLPYPRPLPLRSLSIKKVIQASDFGAVPDDGKDDADAIARALSALKNAPGTMLVFKKGIYNLKKSMDDSRLGAPIFTLEGLRDIQIDGRGSLFLVGRPNSGFMRISGCKNIIIENLQLDYSPLPYSIGRVLRVQERNRTFDIKILNGYPALDDRHFQEVQFDPHRKDDPSGRAWGYFIDKFHPGRVLKNTENVYFPENIERLSGDIYRYHVKGGQPGTLNNVAAGDIFTYLTRCGDGFYFIGDDQVTIRNATLYASGGASFIGLYNNCLNFINCRIKLREGRYKTSNADGFHFQNSRCGPWIEGCLAEGMSDDCVNIYVRPNFIDGREGARTLRICKPEGPSNPMDPKDYAAGDEVQFFDGSTGKVIFTAKVARVYPRESMVEFDRDIPSLRFGMDKMRCTSLYNTSLSNGWVIKGNHFRNARRYGLLLRAQNGYIKNNTFLGLSSDAITFQNESTWPEGLFSKNVIVSNNDFTHCGFEYDYNTKKTHAAVSLFCSLLPDPKAYYAHRNIRLTHNTFKDWWKIAIYISNARDITVTDNKIGVPRQAPSCHEKAEASIITENVTDVTLKGNRFPASLPKIIRK